MLRKLFPILLITAVCTAAQTGNKQSPIDRIRDLRVVHADVPFYPQVALSGRISGTVKVEVSVQDGNVVNAQVKSGPLVLARAAVENIRNWRFYPLANATFTTKFIYQLEKNESLNPQNPKVELQLPLLVKITAVPIPLSAPGATPPTSTTH
jgi:TonB family protein